MSDFYEDLEESLRHAYEPATPAPDDKIQPWGETRVVGKSLPRVDAYNRVSGAAQYTQDVILPDMLYAAVLRCPHASALVKSVDTAAAEKMPGVLAVLTGKSPGTDIPWYGAKPPQSKLFDPRCRYEGEEVAAVAAQTPYQAWDAVKAIKVEYEQLPFVLRRGQRPQAGRPEGARERQLTWRAARVETGRCREGFRRGGRRARGDVLHERADPRPDGDPFFRGEVGRRPAHHLGVVAGRLRRGAFPGRARPRDAVQQGPGDLQVHGGRVWLEAGAWQAHRDRRAPLA